MTNFKKQGKNNRARGKRFELKVRADLEKKGWIVFRNSNDVEQIEYPEGSSCGYCKFKQAKTKWNFFTKMPMTLQSGFPDFVCIKMNEAYKGITSSVFSNLFDVQFVECKGGDEKHKYLSKVEKEKVEWIKENLKIPVLIANKGDKRGEIKYE